MAEFILSPHDQHRADALLALERLAARIKRDDPRLPIFVQDRNARNHMSLADGPKGRPGEARDILRVLGQCDADALGVETLRKQLNRKNPYRK